MADKPTIIGESNPYGGDPYYALYPAPDGCSGHRLCCLILGMHRHDYLSAFERANLCVGKWSLKAARLETQKYSGRLILLGSKVASAFGYPFSPFRRYGHHLILPHPSGLCRLWNEPMAFASAMIAVSELAPELKDLIGAAAVATSPPE